MGPPSPILTRLFVEMSTSLVFACLSGRLELEDLFLSKKKTNAKQRHLTESSRRISIVRHHFSASQRIAAYLRVISQGSETDPETDSETSETQTEGNSVGSLGSQADSAKCGFRPLAENLDGWRSQLRRPRGREAIAEIPNGLASETLQSLFSAQKRPGRQGDSCSRKLFFVFNIQEKKYSKKKD